MKGLLEVAFTMHKMLLQWKTHVRPRLSKNVVLIALFSNMPLFFQSQMYTCSPLVYGICIESFKWDLSMFANLFKYPSTHSNNVS